MALSSLSTNWEISMKVKWGGRKTTHTDEDSVASRFRRQCGLPIPPDSPAWPPDSSRLRLRLCVVTPSPSPTGDSDVTPWRLSSVAFSHQASSTKANLAIILLASTLRPTCRSRACSRLCSRKLAVKRMSPQGGSEGREWRSGGAWKSWGGTYCES
jgi:hypothetical protein